MSSVFQQLSPLLVTMAPTRPLHILQCAQALFRRGVANARLGSLEDAKADLLAVIKADPRNGGAKKELKVRFRS